MANKIEKQFSADNMKLIINVLTGLMASTDTLSEKCIDDFDETKTYPPKSACFYDGYLWQSITTAYGAWDENKWRKLSDDFTELTVSDIQSWIGLSQEQLETMTNLISTEIRLDKVFSSSETYTRIDNALKEAKQYCISQLAQKSVNKADIVDNLTSTDTDKPLSAKQGKVLDDKKLNKADADKITIINADGVNIKDFILEKCTDKNKVYYITTRPNCTDMPTVNASHFVTVENAGYYTIKVTAKELVGKNNEYVCTYRSDSAKWSDWEKVLVSSDILTAKSDTATDEKIYSAKSINSQLNEMKQNFQDGVDTVYDAVVAKGTTPVDKTPSEIAIAIRKLGGELTSIYNALITRGLPMTGEESEDQIAAIITDLMTINVTTKTDSNTFVFNDTAETIKDPELVDTNSYLALEFSSEELTSVESGGYIEFAEIDKTEYNNKIKFM